MTKIKRVVLAGNFLYSPWYEEAWARGLECLGVQVVRFPIKDFISRGLAGGIERRFLLGPGLDRANRQILQLAAEAKPDVFIIYSGNLVKPGTVEKLRENTWVSGYHNDNLFGRFGHKAYFRWYKRALPLYNSHHVYREENILQYQKAGCKKVGLLRSYYVPWLHHPPHSSSSGLLSRLAHDVVFVGHGENDRRIGYVETLLNAGIRLKIYGGTAGWQRYLSKKVLEQVSPIQPVYGDDYSNCLHHSRICLCFLSGGNKDTYTRRCFEIPACGGFLLCERTETMLSLYDEGKEAEYFSGVEELLEKVRFYLGNEPARKLIASKGYQRCLGSGYDVISRMQQWLRETEAFMEQASISDFTA